MKTSKTDILNGERPHRMCLAVSYIETDSIGRCMPRLYVDNNVTLWYKDGEDAFAKLDYEFKMIEDMLSENAKRGHLCFLARKHFFYREPSLDERINSLKGYCLSKEQIQKLRQMADKCEKELYDE